MPSSPRPEDHLEQTILDEVLRDYAVRQERLTRAAYPPQSCNWSTSNVAIPQEAQSGMASSVPFHEDLLNVPTNTIWNANFISAPPMYARVSATLDGDGGWLTAPDMVEIVTEEKPTNHKWPIGTIVKWNMNLSEIRSHLSQLNRKSPLIRIVDYFTSGDIKRMRWLGDAEDDIYSIPTKYFVSASAADIIEFETAQATLNLCQSRPEIGVVLEYLGNRSQIRGCRGTVLGHGQHNKIYFHWFNDAECDQYTDWSKFRVYSSQKHKFVPKDEDYCTCKNCNSKASILGAAISPDTEGIFCSHECALEADYYLCSCCHQYHHDDDMADVDVEGDVCQNCFDVHYGTCSCCERHFNTLNMINFGSEFTCHHCVENSRRTIHGHDFKPRFLFNKMEWENTRYLGIELEVECEHSRDTTAKMIKTWLSQQPPTPDVTTRDGKLIKGKTLDKLVYIKSDGSLHNGIEIVFHPFTLKSFHKNFPLKGFLSLLKNNGCFVLDNCGMHVHVSKEKLSKIELLKGKWLFHKCQLFLKKFSERTRFDYCKFEPYEPLPIPWDQEYGHYSVLNIASQSAKTMEVRLFNATLDHTKFLANLQFSDVLVDYIQHGAPTIAGMSAKSAHVMWQHFIDYAKSKNMYHIFTRWILTKAIV